MKAYEELVAKLDEIIAANADELIAYSDDVADHPELGEEEFRTSQAIKTLSPRYFPVIQVDHSYIG